MTSPRTLIVGHDAETHDALKRYFDVRYVVADAPGADASWWDVHYLRQPLTPPTFDAINDGTLAQILSRYHRFADINSRRFVTVNARESETYNGLVATYYWAHHTLIERNIELVLFANLPHEGFDFVVYTAAKTLGIKTVMTNQSIFPNRFWLCETVEDFGLFETGPTLSELIPSQYELPKSWFYMANVNRDWTYSARDLAFETIRRPWRFPAAAFRYYYDRQFRIDQLRATHVPTIDEEYIYVPLHLQPELSSSAVGGLDGRYADQAAVIEQLSLWAPSGVSICVKENPKQTSRQRGPLFYRRLDALPNVRWVKKDLPSRDLIAGAIGVATISGTAGWEALFQGKPVLLFGGSWYRQMPGVSTFHPTLHFDDWVRRFPPSIDAVVECLDRTLTHAGSGIVDADYRALVKNFDPLANADSIAMSISAYCRQAFVGGLDA